MTQPAPRSFWRPVNGRSFALVVLGAAMWGLDPLFRRGLALSLPASTIVFVEHLLPVVLILPLVVRGLKRAARTFSARDWGVLAVLGFGSSASATVLFTLAFTYGSPTTPVLLQQIQPLIAVAGAWIILRERPRQLYGLFLASGLVGAYLLAFADPNDVGALEWKPALLAVVAAVLWGLGTVIGRRLSAEVPFGELTGLRLVFGLVAATVITAWQHDFAALGDVDGEGALALIALALIPGLFSLLVYYRGLRGTPASAATLGELAFPLTTLIVGYAAFADALTVSQWIGVGLLAVTMTIMGVTKPDNTPTAVTVQPIEMSRSA